MTRKQRNRAHLWFGPGSHYKCRLHGGHSPYRHDGYRLSSSILTSTDLTNAIMSSANLTGLDSLEAQLMA